MENIHEEVEIDLKELFFALRRKIWLILASALLTGCLAAGYAGFLATPVYSSTSTVLVLSKETTLTSLADLQLGSQLANDYKVLINSRPVLEKVIENLGLTMGYKELRQAITVENPTDTRILELTVQNPDAQLARELVDELASVSSEYIGDKMEVTPPKIIETGETAAVPDSPDAKKITLLGAAVGFLLAAGILTVLHIMDESIRTEEDVARYLNLATFAVVPDKAQEKTSGKRKKEKGKR